MDKGHENLMRDLKGLLQDAHEFQFHDFKNDKHAMPKTELWTRLYALCKNVKNGRYDNR